MTLIGYMRVLKADGSQTTDLQRDTLLAAGEDPDHLYEDRASGKKEDRRELASCLKARRPGDILLVWKLDRLGRDLRHLVNIVHDLTARDVSLKALIGQGAAGGTTTAQGKLVFGNFAALAEFERELISEHIKAGVVSTRTRGRKGGRPFKMARRSCVWPWSRWDNLRPTSQPCARNSTSPARLSTDTSPPPGSYAEDGRKLLTGS